MVYAPKSQTLLPILIRQACRKVMHHPMGYAQNYGPLLVIDYITEPSSKGYQNGTLLLGISPHVAVQEGFLESVSHLIDLLAAELTLPETKRLPISDLLSGSPIALN